MYFLCSFCLYFRKIVWWFYFNEVSNCCFCQPPRLLALEIFANLPVYCFDQNLPASSFISSSPLKLESKYSKPLVKSQGDLKLLSVYKLLRESLSKILRPKYFFSSDENFVLQYIISIFPLKMLIAFLIFFYIKNNQAHVGYFTPSVSPWN